MQIAAVVRRSRLVFCRSVPTAPCGWNGRMYVAQSKTTIRSCAFMFDHPYTFLRHSSTMLASTHSSLLKSTMTMNHKVEHDELSLSVGDLVEVRRSNKTFLGVVVQTVPIVTLLANGHTITHGTTSVFFHCPKWAFSVNQKQTESDSNQYARSDVVESAVGISVETAQMLQSAYIQPSITNNLASLTRDTEHLLVVHRPSFMSLFDRIKESGIESICINDAARIVFGNNDQENDKFVPSPAQRLAMHRYLAKSVALFVPEDSSRLAMNELFRLRTQQERLDIESVLGHVKQRPTSNQKMTEFQEFLQKCRKIIETSRKTEHDSMTQSQLKIQFTDTDNLFFSMIEKSLNDSMYFPSFEKTFAQSAVISRLSPLYSNYPTDMDVILFLRETGVHAPWENPTPYRPTRKGRMSFIVGSIADVVDEKSALIAGRIMKTKPIVENSIAEGYDLTEPLIQESDTKTNSGSDTNISSKCDTWTISERFTKDLITLPSYSTDSEDWAPQDDLKNKRVDFGSSRVFIIDSPTAHELDDGFSIDQESDDVMDTDWVHVHIADPTAYIKPTDDLALIAQMRGNTTYLPERHYPMLPDILTRLRLDLRTSPLVLTFSAKIGSDGEIVDYRVQPAVVSNRLVTQYNVVDDVLDWSDVYGHGSDRDALPMWIRAIYDRRDSKTSDVSSNAKTVSEQDAKTLRRMQSIVKRHKKWRLRNGSLSPDNISSFVSVEPYPLPKQMTDGSYNTPPDVILKPFENHSISPSHNLVSEMMIIAGRVCARYCLDHGIPVPYRGQEAFDDHLATYISSIRDPNTGYIPYRAVPMYFSGMGKQGGMPAAQWSMTPLGHSAMGLPQPRSLMDTSMIGYVKVTSPLRRYKDMLSHWQIKSHMASKPLPFRADQVTQLVPYLQACENRTREISTRSNRYWMCEWVRRRELKSWIKYRYGSEDKNSVTSQGVWDVPERMMAVNKNYLVKSLDIPHLVSTSVYEKGKSSNVNMEWQPVYHAVIVNTGQNQNHRIKSIASNIMPGDEVVSAHVVELGGHPCHLIVSKQMMNDWIRSNMSMVNHVVKCKVVHVDPTFTQLVLKQV